MRNKLVIISGIFVWLTTVAIAFYYLLTANVSFWFDPARDLLSAWGNLHKVTLIGPPSGIPGFFYGPYWIWWLSIGLLFSKDPVIVTAITITIPYLVGFAGLLWLFSKLFGKVTSILLWLLYFLSFQGTITQLWNPYLAPLLFLAIIYIFIFHVKKGKNISSLIPVSFAGILTGIALNVHISFSVGFALGCIIFLLSQTVFSTSKKTFFQKFIEVFLPIVTFCGSILLTFLPFFLFEVRHGFHQTKIALNAFLHGGAVVLTHGLSKQDIVLNFLGKFSELTKIPSPISLIILAVMVVVVLVQVKKSSSHEEKKLFQLITTISVCVLGVYLLAKNPIWPYHFIGTEVLCLLFIGIFVSKLKIAKGILFIWILYLCVGQYNGLRSDIAQNPLTRGSLYTKEYIVRIIQQDAGNREYTAYAYSPSIYTYEYNYLFRWIAGKEFSYDPRQIERKGIVYVILPPAWPAFLEDFTHDHSPVALYKTTKEWHLPDGTIILRRSPL